MIIRDHRPRHRLPPQPPYHHPLPLHCPTHTPRCGAFTFCPSSNRWFPTATSARSPKRISSHGMSRSFHSFERSFFRTFVLSFFRSFILSLFGSFVLSISRSFVLSGRGRLQNSNLEKSKVKNSKQFNSPFFDVCITFHLSKSPHIPASSILIYLVLFLIPQLFATVLFGARRHAAVRGRSRSNQRCRL